jgi:hypothetical protein
LALQARTITLLLLFLLCAAWTNALCVPRPCLFFSFLFSLFSFVFVFKSNAAVLVCVVIYLFVLVMF